MAALSTILNGGFGGSDLRRQVGIGHTFLPITLNLRVQLAAMQDPREGR